jgi:hypothetical protein
MANYIDVKQAKAMTGLQIVASPGSIAPWSEAVKQIFTIKRIPFALAAQKLPGPDLELQEWTAQSSAPVAVWNDERPRSTWLEQLYLAERLASDPPLIPAVVEDRVQMIGLINEICGETGLAWSGRLRYLHHQLRATEPRGHHRANDVPKRFVPSLNNWAKSMATALKPLKPLRARWWKCCADSARVWSSGAKKAAGFSLATH